MSEADLRRLTAFLRTALSASEGESANAFSLLRKTIERHDIHPGDLEIVLLGSRYANADEFATLINDLRNEAHRLQRIADQLQLENAELRIRVKAEPDGGTALRALQREIRLAEWQECNELINTRVFQGRVPKDWRKKIADFFGITIDILTRYERGRAVIPAEIIKTLHDLPAPQNEIVLRSAAERLAPETIERIAKLLFGGATATEISVELNVNEPAKSILTRRPPAELRIQVKKEHEPTNWFELWEISTALFGYRTWKTTILTRLAITRDVPFREDVNALVDLEQLQRLRQQYWEQSPWGIFVRVSSEKWDEGKRDVSWWEVVPEARDKYRLRVSNDIGSAFMQRFNEEYYPLYSMKQGS
jgi:hypothetical protein